MEYQRLLRVLGVPSDGDDRARSRRPSGSSPASTTRTANRGQQGGRAPLQGGQRGPRGPRRPGQAEAVRRARRPLAGVRARRRPAGRGPASVAGRPVRRAPTAGAAAGEQPVRAPAGPLRVLGRLGEFSEFFRTFFSGAEARRRPAPAHPPRRAGTATAPAGAADGAERSGGGTPRGRSWPGMGGIATTARAGARPRARPTSGRPRRPRDARSRRPSRSPRRCVPRRDAPHRGRREAPGGQDPGRRGDGQPDPAARPGRRVRGGRARDLVLVVRVRPAPRSTRDGATFPRAAGHSARGASGRRGAGADAGRPPAPAKIRGTSRRTIARRPGDAALRATRRGDLRVRVRVVLPGRSTTGAATAAAPSSTPSTSPTRARAPDHAQHLDEARTRSTRSP